MKLVHNKDFKNLSEKTYKHFNDIGMSTDDGSISRLFADIINSNISEFYEELTEKQSQAFITTATGYNLEDIGKLMNCTRLEEETDSDYRKRIANQVLYLTSSNETAIRLAVLAIEGIKDVIMRKHTNGPGSFTVIPICSNYDATLIATVESVVHGISSYGEKIIVRPPREKLVKLNINLVLGNIINESERNELRVSVSKEISKYINSINSGEAIVINELTNAIMSCDEKIINYSCNSFKINNKEHLFINQGSMWDEKFRISRDENSLIVY